MSAGTRAYREAEHQEWVDWYLDPQTTSEDGLRAALATLPPGGLDDPWLAVWAELERAISDAIGDLLPQAPAAPPPGQEISLAQAPTADEARWYEILDMKRRLLGEEHRRRLRALHGALAGGGGAVGVVERRAAGEAGGGPI